MEQQRSDRLRCLSLFHAFPVDEAIDIIGKKHDKAKNHRQIGSVQYLIPRSLIYQLHNGRNGVHLAAGVHSLVEALAVFIQVVYPL